MSGFETGDIMIEETYNWKIIYIQNGCLTSFLGRIFRHVFFSFRLWVRANTLILSQDVNFPLKT